LISKHCNRCAQTKTAGEFNRRSKAKDGLASECRSCSKVRSKNWYEENAESVCARTGDYQRARRAKATKQVQHWQRTEGWASHLVSKAKQRCKKTGAPFDIDIAWVLSLFERQGGCCFWFHVPFKCEDVKRNPYQPSLDRIDCSGGYTKDNVVLSCAAANIGRSDGDANRFRSFADEVSMGFSIYPPSAGG
jgi:hypothetical protein